MSFRIDSRTFRTKAIVVAAFLSIILVSSFFPTVVAAEVRLATWNVMRMNEKNKNLDAMADVIRYFDFVALQEIMSPDAATNLASKMIEKTGEEWNVMVSHPIGRGTYKEIYAFLWRESKVNYVDAAVVYIDDRDVFEREPVSARFRAVDEDFSFIAANVHVIYGNSKERRKEEVRALRSYWHWLHDQWPEDPVFLFGDFNMTPDEDAWHPLLEISYPVVTKGATTLSTIEGQFANLYDNIWIPRGLASDHMVAGILDFPSILKVTHQTARKDISDHAPVFLEIGSLTSLHESPLPAYIPARFEMASEMQEERAPFIGNLNSRIYHWPGCPGYDALSDENMVPFESAVEAEEAGYRAARNC